MWEIKASLPKTRSQFWSRNPTYPEKAKNVGFQMLLPGPLLGSTPEEARWKEQGRLLSALQSSLVLQGQHSPSEEDYSGKVADSVPGYGEALRTGGSAALPKITYLKENPVLFMPPRCCQKQWKDPGRCSVGAVLAT